MASKPKKSTAKSAQRPATAQPKSQTKWVILAVLGVVIAFGVYQFAVASRNSAANSAGSAAPQASTSQSASSDITGPEVDGTAVVSGGVQKIQVAVSNVYNPNVINLKAGLPADITFSGGQGCTTSVQSQQLGFQADMTSGPQTVHVRALQPGTYSFACGMNMVHGKVIVR
jgi:plastocyanin